LFLTIHKRMIQRSQDSQSAGEGMKFGKLILRKVIEIVATRCQILRLKCTKSIVAGARPQTPLGSLQHSPKPFSWNKGALLQRKRGRKGRGRGREGEGGKGGGGEGRRRGREGMEREVREGRGRGAGKGRRKKGKGKGGEKRGGIGEREGEGKLAIPILICFRRHWLVVAREVSVSVSSRLVTSRARRAGLTSMPIMPWHAPPRFRGGALGRHEFF